MSWIYLVILGKMTLRVFLEFFISLILKLGEQLTVLANITIKCLIKIKPFVFHLMFATLIKNDSIKMTR